MSHGHFYYDDDSFLTEGVMARRIVGWLIDLLVVSLLAWAFRMVLFVFGVLTLGLGFGLWPLLSAVPFCYSFLFLLSPQSATPGQQAMGLTVRRDYDLYPPTPLQALLFTAVFYATLMTSGLLLVVALFTIRHRTLHDIVSGLVVVRVRAMETLTGQGQTWNIHGGTSMP
jgi:uncharacterized RDD family membrane protein YckC